MIYWRETIDWHEHYDYAAGERLVVQDERCFSDFVSTFTAQTGLQKDFLQKITSLKVSGSVIDDFDFLLAMPNLKKIYFLADKSDCWQRLHGTPKIEALSLHNLKCGKHYLSDTAFLKTFPNIKYLYINMLGVSSLPEVADLYSLCAVFLVPRNENSIKKTFDFSSFEKAPSLELFSGSMAVDRHKVPAESFIPVLKNASLRSFTYTQMYCREDKKLLGLMQRYNPSLLETSLSAQAFADYMRKHFA